MQWRRRKEGGEREGRHSKSDQRDAQDRARVEGAAGGGGRATQMTASLNACRSPPNDDVENLLPR